MLEEDSESLGEFDVDETSILVFIDFSEGSRRALVYAADLAADLNTRLHVVHVIHDPGDAPGYYRQKEKKIRKTLSRLEDSAAELMDDFISETLDDCREPAVLQSAQTALPVGLPVRRMAQVAERLKPRLVVIGSHGRTNLTDLLVGSKAAQFVRISPSPVAVVKG